MLSFDTELGSKDLEGQHETSAFVLFSEDIKSIVASM